MPGLCKEGDPPLADRWCLSRMHCPCSPREGVCQEGRHNWWLRQRLGCFCHQVAQAGVEKEGSSSGGRKKSQGEKSAVVVWRCAQRWALQWAEQKEEGRVLNGKQEFAKRELQERTERIRFPTGGSSRSRTRSCKAGSPAENWSPGLCKAQWSTRIIQWAPPDLGESEFKEESWRATEPSEQSTEMQRTAETKTRGQQVRWGQSWAYRKVRGHEAGNAPGMLPFKKLYDRSLPRHEHPAHGHDNGLLAPFFPVLCASAPIARGKGEVDHCLITSLPHPVTQNIGREDSCRFTRGEGENHRHSTRGGSTIGTQKLPLINHVIK